MNKELSVALCFLLVAQVASNQKPESKIIPNPLRALLPQCLKQNDLDEMCASDIDCKGVAVCEHGTCVCDSGYLKTFVPPLVKGHRPTVCVMGPLYGELCLNNLCGPGLKCNQSTGLCDCFPGSGPFGKFCFPECKADEIFVNDKCYKMANVSEPCEISAQCIGSFSSCKDNICSCVRGTLQNGTSCEAVPKCVTGNPLSTKSGTIVQCSRTNPASDFLKLKRGLLRNPRKFQILSKAWRVFMGTQNFLSTGENWSPEEFFSEWDIFGTDSYFGVEKEEEELESDIEKLFNLLGGGFFEDEEDTEYDVRQNEQFAQLFGVLSGQTEPGDMISTVSMEQLLEAASGIFPIAREESSPVKLFKKSNPAEQNEENEGEIRNPSRFKMVRKVLQNLEFLPMLPPPCDEVETQPRESFINDFTSLFSLFSSPVDKAEEEDSLKRKKRSVLSSPNLLLNLLPDASSSIDAFTSNKLGLKQKIENSNGPMLEMFNEIFDRMRNMFGVLKQHFSGNPDDLLESIGHIIPRLVLEEQGHLLFLIDGLFNLDNDDPITIKLNKEIDSIYTQLRAGLPQDKSKIFENGNALKLLALLPRVAMKLISNMDQLKGLFKSIQPRPLDSCPSGHFCNLPLDKEYGKGFCCEKPDSVVTCPVGGGLTEAEGYTCSLWEVLVSRNGLKHCPLNTHFCYTFELNGYTGASCCPRKCPLHRPVELEGRCYPVAKFNDQCLNDKQCLPSFTKSQCLVGADGARRCGCPIGTSFFFGRCVTDCTDSEVLIDGQCVEKKEAGGNCKSHEECGGGTFCQEGFCVCRSGTSPGPLGMCFPEANCPQSSLSKTRRSDPVKNPDGSLTECVTEESAGNLFGRLQKHPECPERSFCHMFSPIKGTCCPFPELTCPFGEGLTLGDAGEIETCVENNDCKPGKICYGYWERKNITKICCNIPKPHCPKYTEIQQRPDGIPITDCSQSPIKKVSSFSGFAAEFLGGGEARGACPGLGVCHSYWEDNTVCCIPSRNAVRQAVSEASENKEKALRILGGLGK